MGSHEVFDPIDEAALVSEAPEEAADSAAAPAAEECTSVPLVSVPSAKSEIDVPSSPMHDFMLVSEAPKEESVESVPFALVSSMKSDIGIDVHLSPIRDIMLVSEVLEEESVDAHQIRTNQDSLVGMCCGEETENEVVAAGLCGVESDMKGSCCPDIKLTEVECVVSRMCLNTNAASSLECLQFSGDDCSSITLGESQIASQNPPVLTGERNIEEGGLPFPYNNSNICFPRNMKSVMDLSDAVNGILVDIPSSPRNGVPNCSLECHERENSEQIDVRLPGINSESSDLQDDVLSGQHLPSYVVEMPSPVKQVNALQSRVPDMVLRSGSPSAPFRQEAFESNGGSQGNNSVAIGCFSDKGQENMLTGDQLFEINEAFLRRSSRSNKFILKAPKAKDTSKGAKKAPGRIIDLLPSAVRSRRSCSRRSARVSNWGLIDTLLKYIELTREGQGSGSVKSGKKSKKKGKIQVSASTHGSGAKKCPSSGHIRLKFKLTNKSKAFIEPIPSAGTDTKVAYFTGNSDKQLDLSNSIKEVTEEGSQKSLQCSYITKLDKSATSHENPRVTVLSVHEDFGSTLVSDKCSRNDIGGRSSSEKEIEKSGVSTDDRHLNSGTSPDSEVIQVPDSQFASEVLEVHHDGGKDSSKVTTLTPAENAIPAISKTRKKKGNKMEKLFPPDDSDVQSSLLSSSIIKNTEMARNNRDNCPKSDLATSFVVGHELADSMNSTRLLPPAKADRNRKSKSKLKPSSSTPRLDVNKSRGVKGDKWKLVGKYSVCENGISNQAHIKDDDPEVAGKDGMGNSGNTTNSITSGVTPEGVSGLAVIPGGVGKQIAQSHLAWVCCDDCLKWRCIPSNLADIIDETDCRWTCKDNQDRAFADCSVPQEKSNADINAELNISDAEEGHAAQLSGPQQSSWMLIKSNIYLHRKRKTQTVDEIMVCHCKLARDGRLGCGDECLNRMLNIECVQGTCPCGDVCANQQFQRQSYANLKWFRSGKKGYGLQLIENVTQGQFLIEYVGEVLELPAYEERLGEYAANGHKHFYFMTLNGNEVIDACAKGNLGRFINHSCDPNCRTEKWMVNGEICIGIFAVRDIKKGEELTFDYNYVRVFGAAAKKCHCGSAHCRGYIGGDRLNNEIIVQGDSDEEFPEPVAVYENGEIADEYNIMSKCSSLNVMEEKEDSLMKIDVGITLNDTDMMNKLELPEDGILDSVVGYSQINSCLETVGYTQAENVDKTTLDVEQEKPTSICSVSPKRSESLVVNNESVDIGYNSSLTGLASGKAVDSKAHPRMKVSRPSKSIKNKESSDSIATIKKALVTSSKLQATPNKLKKPVESPVKHRLETVEDKLNELLDNAGGICKRKDAFKGYLRLLVLTAASGDFSRCETIQSNKDLSMILDAILKTKSRTVLTDILTKNGLQMLHSLMKKCRGNFNKIPILRKLMKVFEFLAERKMLTLEHINAEPPRPGMESFRDSILSLTEYEDKKVHQIARNFRDRWIPRPIKKFNSMEKGERNMDFNGAPNSSRSLGTHQQRFDHVERLSDSMDYVKQSHPSNHQIDSDGCLEGSQSPRFSVRRKRKRKSGWDQLPDAVSPCCIKEQKTSDDNLKNHHREIHSCNEDDERQLNEEDAPPGFSFPSFGSPHLSNRTSLARISFSQQYPGPLKCPSEMPVGYPEERYNSDLPMALGMPFNNVQEFGTPESSAGGGWVIAPGMPFRPFPPLPQYPCQRWNREVPPPYFNGVGSAGKSQECYLTDAHMDQGCPSSSTARLPDTIPNGNTHPQHGRGHYRHERRYSDQRLDGKGTASRKNYSVTPPGVVVGTTANSRTDRPENVNYGVEFAGNSC